MFEGNQKSACPCTYLLNFLKSSLLSLNVAAFHTVINWKKINRINKKKNKKKTNLMNYVKI